MSRFLSVVAAVSIVMPLAAQAQNGAAASPSVEVVAEHKQWEADHQKWSREHVALAARLRAIATAIERGDDGLMQHGSEITVHGAALQRGTDSAALEATHARLRSEHEEARIAHHDLVDAVRALEVLARDDEKTRTIEDDQRETTPAPR